MAENVSISKKIVCSDSFLDMPIELQTLYFHLVMNAREKGILNNAVGIAKTICLDKSALTCLVENGYLVEEVEDFNLNYRIVHWYDHSLIGSVAKKRNNHYYRKWRNQIIERDKRCQKCGSKEKLHAHHIKEFHKYPKLRFDLSNGVALCQNCHFSLHKEIRRIQNGS
jgi:hypothetical protein